MSYLFGLIDILIMYYDEYECYILESIITVCLK